MSITFTSLESACPGKHWRLVGTAGGQAFDIVFDRADMALDPDDHRIVVMILARHLAKDAGAVTLAQARAAIAGKTVKV